MEIRDYVRVITRRWWVIVLVCAVAAGSSLVYSRLQPKIYRASVKLLAEPNRADYGLSLFLSTRFNSYKQELSTPSLAQQVIDRAQLDTLPDTLLEMVKVAPNADESTIQITVDDQSPTEAQVIANTMADIFVEKVTAKNSSLAASDLRVDIVKLETPTVPAQPNSPNTKINVLAGAILGFLIGGLLAFAWEFLDDTLKTPEDVQRFVSLSTLGSIPTIPDEPGGKQRNGRGLVSHKVSTLAEKD